ncbi:peptidase domain-containing ABC transporter [Salmonella enterica subsp. enterica]|nr:peptidase domain-containing ABC transporter [Salmonella enterica subsp. enterica]EDY2803434.1 peptidase domain-containing ABC transporter [Salmonella enterica subsp. enterica]
MRGFKLFELKKIFNKTVPVILQSEVSECALACLAMISGYYGYKIDLYSLRDLFEPSANGMTLKQVISVAEKINLNARASRVELNDLYSIKKPVIIHWDFNHYVILTKVDKKGAIVNDPSKGKRYISLFELSNSFTGIILELWPSESFQKKNVSVKLTLLDLFRGVRGIYHFISSIILISIIVEIFYIVVPLATQFTVDVLLRTGDIESIYIVIISVIAALIVRTLFAIVRAWILMSLRYNLSISWSEKFFNKMVKLPLSFFEKRHVGDISSRLTSLMEVQQSFTAELVISLLDIFVVFFVGSLLINLGFSIFISPFIVMLVYIIFKGLLFSAYKTSKIEAINYEAIQSSHFIETVRAIASIKVLSMSHLRRHEWVNRVVNTSNATTKLFKFDLVFKTVSDTLISLSGLGVLAVSAFLVESGEFTNGSLIASIMYADMFITRIVKVIDAFFNFKMVTMHCERLTDIALSDSEDISEPLSPVSMDLMHGSISISGLSYRHSHQEPFIFEKVSFEIMPGESIAITGVSGCGKSTLLNVISGLYSATEGNIYIDGVDVKMIGIHQLREKISFVMQDDKLLAASIMENITSFDSSPDFEKMYECAKLSSIHDEIMEMPMKYNSMIGDMGNSLSGGQRQRISIARALYRRPLILLMDEATSDLDTMNENNINNSIKNLAITRIFVAHRPQMIESADRVFDLKNKVWIR